MENILPRREARENAFLLAFSQTFGDVPLQEALTAFAKKSNEYCTGTVNIKLYKGNMINAGITSSYSLYSENLVTFGESDFNQAEAAGFINIWGLPTKVQALREQGKL